LDTPWLRPWFSLKHALEHSKNSNFCGRHLSTNPNGNIFLLSFSLFIFSDNIDAMCAAFDVKKSHFSDFPSDNSFSPLTKSYAFLIQIHFYDSMLVFTYYVRPWYMCKDICMYAQFHIIAIHIYLPTLFFFSLCVRGMIFYWWIGRWLGEMPFFMYTTFDIKIKSIAWKIIIQHLHFEGISSINSFTNCVCYSLPALSVFILCD